MSPILWRVLTLALCWLLSGAASAGELRQKLFTAKTYSGSRDRHYQIFVPSTYTGQDVVPLVMVLHGCRQTEANMINETRFKDLAERDNFIVVYPFITSYDGMRDTNCWGFFLDQHIHKGAGEVEDLHQIALEIEAELKIDPDRRYVCQSALDWDPLSASKRDPFERRVRPVALPPSELAGVAETVRARVV